VSAPQDNHDPEESAALLHIGDDVAGLDLDDYVIEKISNHSRNGTGMVELTLVWRASAGKPRK
jgi:hypothetical protein